MARMRLIKEAFKELKERDPDTAITFYSLRCMVLSGEIPSIKAGNRRLINMDVLERVLQGQRTTSPTR